MWKTDKGFGFIRPDDGTREVFAHIKDFGSKSREPFAGDPVSYEIALDPQIRLQAVSVRFRDGRSFHLWVPGRKVLMAGFIGIYAFALGFLVHTSRLPAYVPLTVVLLSIISWFVYKNDKRASERGRQRVSERSLHFLSLLGGWPGALAAQVLLRHKSSKTGFSTGFYVTVFLNMASLGYVAMLR